MDIPHLQLTLGQVAWALNFGQPVPKFMLDKLNYLRQLGIPFSDGEQQPGSGKRIYYGYDEMVEMGVALSAMANGMKPADIVRVLIGQRARMREFYRQALAEQPAAGLTASWVRSRGREFPILGNSIDLRLHDRYSESPGKVELANSMYTNGPNASMSRIDTVETFAGQTTRKLVPLTMLAMQWTVWALEAPQIKRGPKE